MGEIERASAKKGRNRRKSKDYWWFSERCRRKKVFKFVLRINGKLWLHSRTGS